MCIQIRNLSKCFIFKFIYFSTYKQKGESTESSFRNFEAYILYKSNLNRKVIESLCLTKNLSQVKTDINRITHIQC